jgi:hypothetical protein
LFSEGKHLHTYVGTQADISETKIVSLFDFHPDFCFAGKDNI